MEIHPLTAIGTEDFAVKEVDQRGSDFLGFLHLCLPCYGGCIHDVLHLLEVLTGNYCFMGVREYNPLVLIFDIVGLDSLVDGNHRPAKYGIAHIMRIGQNTVDRRFMPALTGASVTGSRAVLTLSQLGIGRT